MSDDLRDPTYSPTSDRLFATYVQPSPDGGWLAVVDVGDGASASKWFQDRAAADRYGDELAAWLASRRA